LTAPADYGELLTLMKKQIVAAILLTVIAGVSAMAQERLYPVRGRPEVSVLITSDRSSFAIDRAFQHKLILGYPSDDRLSLLPGTDAPLVILSLRIQNTSPRPLVLDISKFAITDDEGKTYPNLKPDDAYARMLADASSGSIGSKTLRGLSLGKVGGKRTEQDVKEDFVRYSLQSGEIPAGSVKEGMIYFEAPKKKKYTLGVSLGDLWSKPLPFSTEKQK
jgi:hypothetical protein